LLTMETEELTILLNVSLFHLLLRLDYQIIKNFARIYLLPDRRLFYKKTADGTDPSAFDSG